MMNILVINPQENSGILHPPLVIDADGRWQQRIQIGEPEDFGKNFEIHLVIIRKESWDTFAEHIGYKSGLEDFTSPITIKGILGIIDKLRLSLEGRRIFDNTFQQITVTRKPEIKPKFQ